MLNTDPPGSSIRRMRARFDSNRRVPIALTLQRG